MNESSYTGGQFRIRLEHGRPGVDSSSGTVAYLESEDDDNWFPCGNGFDALWLGDLANVAERARVAFVALKVRSC